MTYTWQSMTKNIQSQDLGLKFNRRLDKIKLQLLHFPQNSVHLNIALEKNPKKDLFTASLTLRVPSNILRATKTAEKMMTAFDKAADALIREIQNLKADLRGEYKWEQKGRRAALREAKLTRFGPLPTQEPVPEVLPELFETHRERIRNYVRRQIERDEFWGLIPAGEIDPDAIMDTVARRAVIEFDTKPDDQIFKIWFYALADDELRHECQLANEQPNRRMVNPIVRKYNPPAGEPLTALLPSLDPSVQAEIMETIQGEASKWTDDEKAIFDLRYLEGFNPDEIASLTRMDPDRVTATAEVIEQRVHECVERLAQPVS